MVEEPPDFEIEAPELGKAHPALLQKNHPPRLTNNHRAISSGTDQGTETTASGPGKLFGTGRATFPVAAHSVPRSMTD